jgi:hypothetical protein
MPRPRGKLEFQLPENVTRQVSKGREYFYFQTGRGTKNAGPRIRLPDNPHDPEFWIEYRKAQGHATGATIDTVDASADEFLVYVKESDQLAPGTKDQYQRGLKIAKKAWGPLSAKGLRPSHIVAMMDGMKKTPGAANNFLGALRAWQTWALKRDHIEINLTKGVTPYPKENGHKPWSPAQIEAAKTKLTGMMRRGVMLYMYTGMRGSDAVRMGPNFLDEGGLSYVSQKTSREVYCPIVPELELEMATWEVRQGPFLYQENGRAIGRPYTRKLFSRHFKEVRAEIPELHGASLHGLRCTAVVRLRRLGLTISQIQDIVGLSLAMIERYSRFADKKANGKAALETLKRAIEEQQSKTLQNSETEMEE